MPLTALLWDEQLMSGLITSITGEDWNSWVTSLEVGDVINNIIRLQGIIFILFAATLLIRSEKKMVQFHIHYHLSKSFIFSNIEISR